jgi:hypothetical protein
MPKKATPKKKTLKKKGILQKFAEGHALLRVILPLIVLGAFILSAILLIGYYRYSLNPDGIAYIEIAKKYAQGDITQAINGYWSPLVSWLLALFVLLDVDPQLAYRWIALASSFLSLVGLWVILRKSIKRWYIEFVMLVSFATMLLSWSLAGPITGDILFLTAAIWLVVSFNYFISARSWLSVLLLSVNGAWLYYAKSVGFFIFIGALLLFALLEFKQHKFSKIFKGYIIVGSVFLIFTLPYAAAISYKYKTLTVSTAGKINLLLVSTQYSDGSTPYLHPINTIGPFGPAPQNLSAWEDPTVFTDFMMGTFHDLEVSDRINNYYHSLLYNTHFFITAFTPILLVAGALGVYYLHRTQKTIAITLAVISIITLLAYLLTYFEPRYVYIATIAAILGVAVIIDKQGVRTSLILSCPLLLLIVGPINTLISSQEGSGFRREAGKVSRSIPKGSEVLSDDFSSIYFCYYGQFRCHATVSKIDKSLDTYAKQNNTQYFLLFNTERVKQAKFQQFVKENNITVINTKGRVLLN